MVTLQTVKIMHLFIAHLLKVNNKPQIFIILDCAVAKHGTDIQHAQPTHFEKVA